MAAVNYVFNYGDDDIPLYVAAKRGNLAEVNRLLELGANVNQLSRNGIAPLYTASYYRHIPVVERLLAAPDIDVNKANNDSFTPLIIASQQGYISIVERLLASPKIDVNKAMNDGRTALYNASFFGHLPVVERLLNSPGIDVNQEMNQGATSLYIASYNGDLPIVERLLAVDGIDVNKARNGGATPLWIALYRKRLDVVDRLLDHPNIDVSVRIDDGRSIQDLLKAINPERLTVEMRGLIPTIIKKIAYKRRGFALTKYFTAQAAMHDPSESILPWTPMNNARTAAGGVGTAAAANNGSLAAAQQALRNLGYRLGKHHGNRTRRHRRYNRRKTRR